MSEFRDVFKSLRLSNNLTQDELAQDLEISRSAVSMYERGEREPDFETLEKIADFFNVDMNYLIGWSDDPTNYDDPDLIAAIPLSYMELFDGDVKKAFQYMKAVDAENLEHPPVYAQNEDEEEMLLLARHMEPLSEEDREMLKAQFKSTIDVYLKRKAQGPSGLEDK